MVLALQEASAYFGSERYGRAAAGGADVLAARVDGLEDCSLYFGLAGVAVGLRALGRDEDADRALRRIRDRFDGERWNEMFELLMGNAGIALGALSAGDIDLAVLAVTPYLTTPDRTGHGRCCGTVGVLALACDRIVEQGDDFAFADRLVDDLTARATVDDAGVRWSNHEHRAMPPDLEPLPGWAMGNAGIIRELLRYARLRDDGLPGYAVQWPDQPVALPSQVAE